MDINPNTGKGWTDAEEATFAQIKRVGRIAHGPHLCGYFCLRKTQTICFALVKTCRHRRGVLA